MPKPKQFLRKEKPSKHAKPAPSTADEFLEAGVEFEEAGEKWRGGDALKSIRFFQRAVDAYDEGLKKFPKTFDLAYNKARVQFMLTQHPKLRDHLSTPVINQLRLALDSHRYALMLQETNADVLFNTAQVITSLVEAFNDDPESSDDPVPLLEEALEFFRRCVGIQEYNYTESRAQQQEMKEQSSDDQEEDEDMADSEGGAKLDTNVGKANEEEEWVSIVEPVTNDTLIDTLLAQLECLTTFSSLLPSDEGKGLAWIEEYFTTEVNTRLRSYLLGTEREVEAAGIRANFVAALADANFRSQNIDMETYFHTLRDAYPSPSPNSTHLSLVSEAEAFMSFNASVRMLSFGVQDQNSLDMRFRAVTNALEKLASAAQMPTVESLEKIFLARGDAELFRHQLGREGFAPAIKGMPVMAKNAEKFYRGAAAHAKNAGEATEFLEAKVKETVAIGLGGDTLKVREAAKSAEEGVKEILEGMLDEGMISYEELSAMGVH